jgi:diguanylate cyclase (GGDEF)-like protein
MNIISNIFMNSLSIILLFIIFIYTKKYGDTESTQNKIYLLIVVTTMYMLFLDSISRLDGHNGTILPIINKTGNFLLFLSSPAVSSLWVLYVFIYKLKNTKYIKWLFAFIIAIGVTNFIIVVLSLKYSWFYYIDEQNIYHRGPYFIISTLLTFILMFFASVIVYLKRDRIERKHYYALLLFSVPPFVCIALQVLFYGYSFIYNGVALSALVIFLYVQNQDIFTDYLTGVSNRKKLELHLAKMISGSVPDRTFSAIMIDLDNFKTINDTYGHKAGDEALKKAAELLQNSIGKNDLIARYGGDEFCVVLNTCDPNVLNAIVQKIKTDIKSFNAKNLLPYKLGLSMGFATYKFGTNVTDFINTIDSFMYDHKRSDAI